MTLKKSQQFLAYGLHNTSSLDSKMPAKLLDEARRFVSRNSIAEDKLLNKICCLRCLKAHLIEKSKQLSLPENAVEVFPLLGGEKIGHLGYYMDGGELKKVIQ